MQMTSAQQRIRAVTNYTLEYFQQWHRGPAIGAFEIVAAQTLLAAGRGPARAHSCEQTLRHIRVTGAVNEAFAAEALAPRVPTPWRTANVARHGSDNSRVHPIIRDAPRERRRRVANSRLIMRHRMEYFRQPSRSRIRPHGPVRSKYHGAQWPPAGVLRPSERCAGPMHSG
jgi:hypothetical protein